MNRRVLVVDDEPGVLRFVKASLAMSGYDVLTTTSGEESLQLARTENPDIILLDILMSPLTGFDVLVRLREFSEVPVIVFTARSDIARLALEQGANGFISKPFKPADLAARIDGVLSAIS